MEASVLLFCVGAAASVVFIAGVIWPSSRALYFLLAPKRGVLLAVLAGSAAAIGMSALGFVVYIIFVGYFSAPGFTEGLANYKIYSLLVSVHVSQLVLGLFMGPILFYWLHYYHLREPSETQTLNHTKLTVAICIVTMFSILLPYLHRWFSSATSIEISQIGKISMDAKQSSGQQGGSFTVGYGSNSTPAAVSKGSDVKSALDLVIDLSGTDSKKGVIDRDSIYAKLVDDIGTDATAVGGNNQSVVNKTEEIQNEKNLALFFKPMAECLRKYTDVFSDYRLFLLDTKPLIVDLMTISKAQPAPADQSLAKHELWKHMEDLRKELKLRLKNAKRVVPEPCDSEFPSLDFDLEKGTMLPYRVITLAYMLSAIGSADTAVLELTSWISANRNAPSRWYVIRAQIEQGYLLERILTSGLTDPIYRRFIDDHIADFDKIMKHYNISDWKDRSKCVSRNDMYSTYKQQIIFTYITQINFWVKSMSNLESIKTDVIDRAEINKNVDLACFADLDYVFQDQAGWKGEFLTSHARSLIVSSYDERIYGKAEHSEQRRLRDIAKRELADALVLLNKAVDYPLNPRPSREEERIFWRPLWEASLSSARTAVRSIVDN